VRASPNFTRHEGLAAERSEKNVGKRLDLSKEEIRDNNELDVGYSRSHSHRQALSPLPLFPATPAVRPPHPTLDKFDTSPLASPGGLAAFALSPTSSTHIFLPNFVLPTPETNPELPTSEQAARRLISDNKPKWQSPGRKPYRPSTMMLPSESSFDWCAPERAGPASPSSPRVASQRRTASLSPTSAQQQKRRLSLPANAAATDVSSDMSGPNGSSLLFPGSSIKNCKSQDSLKVKQAEPSLGRVRNKRTPETGEVEITTPRAKRSPKDKQPFRSTSPKAKPNEKQSSRLQHPAQFASTLRS
jgi:hypothetical protein